MTHGLYATAHYNREVTELLRNAATYRARFPTAVSVWGPVFAEATLIDTMMAERGARQEDLGRRWAPRIQNGGSIAQRHINHNRTPTQCISSQRQPHINHTQHTIAQQPQVDELRRVVYAGARAFRRCEAAGGAHVWLLAEGAFVRGRGLPGAACMAVN